ncbi:macro domain-containing protein [Paenibacillus jamilae]|uniref:type II toxin-antitoxin system antitoxin DNA ADP-ribosyl glycohydrolase DarG n=1 Tax=Paenibacillus jamilae TaxID=114136 RepID=UPI003D27734C
MIKYTSGDLLNSSTDALVNTVNCEGYMGKGIAYQFKTRFPENNMDYIRACKSGELVIGKLHSSYEQDKLIINFPTKDKWRAKSKMEYVEKGLDALVDLIHKLNIRSISIPPLGSGNGGLLWSDVKKLIEVKLNEVSRQTEILIYEPSQNASIRTDLEPKLNVAALILMEIKSHLNKFNKSRLQHTTYLVNLISPDKHFRFQKHASGPFDSTILSLSSKIKEYQQYHNVTNTNEAKDILINKIISENVTGKMADLMPIVTKACHFVNSFSSDLEIKCMSIILFIIDENQTISNDEIANKFMAWSEENRKNFSAAEVMESIRKLNEANFIEETLIGYSVCRDQ